MTRRYALALLMLLALAATPLAAQTTAGDLIWQPGGAVPSGPLTYIDFTRPVTMDGTVTDVTLRWISEAPCTEQIKFRFFRPGAGGPLGALELVGTAGPFTSANPAPPGVFPDNNVIRLTFPAIAVKRGDVLAVTQMKSGCGGAGVVAGRADDIVYETSVDFNGGALSASNTIARTGFRLNAAAHTSPFRPVGVIPVAGSAAGAFGSFFRTEVTISNPSPYGMGVALVYLSPCRPERRARRCKEDHAPPGERKPDLHRSRGHDGTDRRRLDRRADHRLHACDHYARL
ncbi:MAG TPA: hypothetical protein VFN10_19150 [Thermoanaerobaculia bacterium]|nr:hypothetical protein [Thermoanaerobaculia bacterium]